MQYVLLIMLGLLIATNIKKYNYNKTRLLCVKCWKANSHRNSALLLNAAVVFCALRPNAVTNRWYLRGLPRRWVKPAALVSGQHYQYHDLPTPVAPLADTQHAGHDGGHGAVRRRLPHLQNSEQPGCQLPAPQLPAHHGKEKAPIPGRPPAARAVWRQAPEG